MNILQKAAKHFNTVVNTTQFESGSVVVPSVDALTEWLATQGYRPGTIRRGRYLKMGSDYLQYDESLKCLYIPSL